MARNRLVRASNNSSKGHSLRHSLANDEMDTSGYFNHSVHHLPTLMMDSLPSSGSLAVTSDGSTNANSSNSHNAAATALIDHHRNISYSGTGAAGSNPNNNPNNNSINGNNNNSNNNTNNGNAGTVATSSSPFNYEEADLDSITLRQLTEDISAYQHDMSFCQSQLNGGAAIGLTPQEVRTLQLRVLDLGHQMRSCQHRVEILRFQKRRGGNHSSSAGAGGGGGGGSGRALRSPYSVPSGTVRPRGSGGFGAGSTPASSSAASGYGVKRGAPHDGDDNKSASSPRVRVRGYSPDDEEPRPRTDEITRLGGWRCRLCKSQKFLLSGAIRQPANPCKWSLRDTSKTIAHYLELHTEHDPDERCRELGDALDHNRGPLEYFLRRTRSADIGNGEVIDTIIGTLQAGELPEELKRYSRAAACFLKEA